MNKQPLLLFVLWTDPYQGTITAVISIITVQSLLGELHVIFNIHLSPGCTESVLCAGHLSCALSEEKESLETEAAGCGRPCL